jgi:hypothetical protein
MVELMRNAAVRVLSQAVRPARPPQDTRRALPHAGDFLADGSHQGSRHFRRCLCLD